MLNPYDVETLEAKALRVREHIIRLATAAE